MSLDLETELSNTQRTSRIKKILRAAFPEIKFTVSSDYDIRVTWNDAPTIEVVKDALIRAGAEVEPRGPLHRTLSMYGRNLNCWSINSAEVAARELEWARTREEAAQRLQRENAALKVAEQTKRERLGGPPPVSREWQGQDPAVYKAFEQLRQCAEQDVDTGTERQVRPSWAPPLIIEGELLDACIGLRLLKPDDKPIARLWATFADPKKTGQALREQRSDHTLAGVQCRGFQLHAGGERGATSDILFEAQRTENGSWSFGPYFRTYTYTEPEAIRLGRPGPASRKHHRRGRQGRDRATRSP